MQENETEDQTSENVLRSAITSYAHDAVKYGHVDRDWVNVCLTRLGAEPVTGLAEYRINVPITGVFGKTIKAKSRGEALAVFDKHVKRIVAQGKIIDGHCDSVYDVQVINATGSAKFYSGPADPPTGENANPPDLAGLKAGIWNMLREGVEQRGWGHRYAQSVLAGMGLPPLPELEYRQVEVPVGGTVKMSVPVFVDSDPDAVRDAARRLIAKSTAVHVVPDEIGDPIQQDTGDVILIDETPI